MARTTRQDAHTGTRSERALMAGGFEEAFLATWHESDSRMAVKAAKAIYADARAQLGYAGPARVLTSGEAQYKLRKNTTVPIE